MFLVHHENGKCKNYKKKGITAKVKKILKILSADYQRYTVDLNKLKIQGNYTAGKKFVFFCSNCKIIPL